MIAYTRDCRGIGGSPVQRTLRRFEHLYVIDLLCLPELQPFYSRLGMQPTTGMDIKYFALQAGAANAGPKP